jgi:threonine/homoserine/homoserine lactone efflux protein
MITLAYYAGFSPGPTVLLVVSHTLRYGYREGLKVSFATIISDVPIILIAFDKKKITK